MAKQTGIITLKGTIGGITFYHTSLDGDLAHQKSSLSKERVMTDDAFIRTRENAVEFGDACEAGKTLRGGLRAFLRLARDRRVTSRLVKGMMTVVHTDSTSVRGKRVVELGDLTLLKGFDFNKNAKLNEVFTAPFTTTVDRAAGTLTFGVPAFIPQDVIVAPVGTTHFKLVFQGSEIDFSTKVVNADSQTTAILPWDGTATSVISQIATVTAGTILPLFMTIGVQFYELVNGNYYPLMNHSYNSLQVVNVDQV